MANGIIIIDKPADWTSMDVCAKLRGILKTKKVGHAGTLDPMATGVLPVFVGQATRGVSFAESGDKEYLAVLRLGLVTNTQDTSGQALHRTEELSDRAALEAVLPRFTGEISQLPPMYSAIKIGGKKLYELARQGKEVERRPRPVTIHALELVEQTAPGLLLVDVQLAEGSGFGVCAYARSRGLPVIFLTASGDESSVVLGLDMGADDYIAKPFRPRELVSRIRSVLRRYGKEKTLVPLGGVMVDTEKGRVTRDGRDVYLSALEYRLLLVFLSHRGKVLSRSQLLEEIWDAAGDFVNDNTLTVYIKRLREKIETDPADPQIIRTVRGIGYMVDA